MKNNQIDPELVSDETIEEWRPVVGYEGLYEVSNMGNVKSLSKYVKNHSKYQFKPEFIMHPYSDRRGYLRIRLVINKIIKTYFVHRLVGSSFCSNYFDDCVVHHIDGNKQNNCLDNLQILTSEEHNKIHRLEKIGVPKSKEHRQKLSESRKGKYTKENHPMWGKHKTAESIERTAKAHRKKVVQYTINGEFVKEWNSIAEAEKTLKLRNISSCCKGRYGCKTSGGFIWKYKEVS